MNRTTAALTMLVLVAGAAGAGSQPASTWRDAPEFLPLFAPAGARASTYRTYVSRVDLETALRGLDGDPALLRTPGGWQPRGLLPADAFGQAGRYDRWRVARLYGAERARVARGARLAGGRVVEAWTLISPYPDARVRRLERGTLLVVVRLP